MTWTICHVFNTLAHFLHPSLMCCCIVIFVICVTRSLAKSAQDASLKCFTRNLRPGERTRNFLGTLLPCFLLSLCILALWNKGSDGVKKYRGEKINFREVRPCPPE